MKCRKTIAAFLFIFSLSFCAASVYAETDVIPKIISTALEKYQKEGVDHLIPTLLIGSPVEGDKTALSQANLFRQIESFYGKYLNAALFKSVSITQTTTLIYFVMNYEKGPLYGSATIFKANGKEIVTTFNFHTEIKQIFPTQIIFD